MRIFILFAVGFAIMWPPAIEAADPSALPEVVRPCAVCHGADGVSKYPNIPNLAGQKIEYLLAETTNMVNSARRRLGLAPDQDIASSIHKTRLADLREYPDMDQQLSKLDEKTILEASAFFAAEPRFCPQPTADRGPAPALIEHCSLCHGRDGVSSDPNVPHLAGQQRFYLIEQLRMFRDSNYKEKVFAPKGKRWSPIMSPQAALIAKYEAEALATWFATAPCAK